MLAKTAAFLAELEKVPVEDLTFLDEAGSNRAMTPDYARGPRGKRVELPVPKNRKKNVSILAAMSLKGIVGYTTREGSFKGDTFLEGFTKSLLPGLKAGAVVVLDNARIHHKVREELKELLKKKGGRLLFLPPYSPEFNPIEKAWSKVKHLLKQAEARDMGSLVLAIKQAFLSVTQSDIKGWFAACGHV